MKLSKLRYPEIHRAVEEFSAEAVGKSRGWFRGKANIIMANKTLGVFLHHIMWRNYDGRVTHDRPVLITRGGAIVLPVDQKGRVGLILKWQPQPADPEKWYREFPNYRVSEVGRWSFEAVGEMGQPGETPQETASRGIKEETGLRVRRITQLGAFCSDTPTIVNPDFYFIAEVEKNPNARRPDKTEGIVGQIRFFTRNQVNELREQGLLYDGRTLALLGIYYELQR